MKIDDIPYNYSYCYASIDQCPKSQNCLRSHAARMNEELETPRQEVPCITPAYVDRVAKGQACAHFRSDESLQYARGMKTIFDTVPKGKYPAVRSRVMNCFSSERVFYYAQNGKQLISPHEQNRIAMVFKNAGLSVPTFDHYELCPDWSV